MKKKVLNGFSTKFLDSDEGNKLYSQIQSSFTDCHFLLHIHQGYLI